MRSIGTSSRPPAAYSSRRKSWSCTRSTPAKRPIPCSRWTTWSPGESSSSEAISAPTRLGVGARASGRGPKSSAEVSARNPEARVEKAGGQASVDERQRARVRVDPAGIDDRDLHPGLGEQVAHPLGLPERLGDDEDGPLRGDGGKARPEDGEPFPGGAPLDSRQAESRKPRG